MDDYCAVTLNTNAFPYTVLELAVWWWLAVMGEMR